MTRDVNRKRCPPLIPGLHLPTTILLFTNLLIAGCAASPPREETVQSRVPGLSEEALADLQLTAYLSGPSARRAMHKTTDIAGWLKDYWLEHDPTPGTPENELLEVYRQRARYLESRFPDTPFGEWSLYWLTFLTYGLPDARGRGFSRTAIARSVGSVRPITPSIMAGVYERIRYESPKPFILVLEPGASSARALENNAPRRPPSLEGVWEELADPGTSVWRKQRAVLFLSWYEVPSVAERLLDLPDEQFAGLEQQRDEALMRLAVRSSCLLEPDEIRRLAALRAAGGAPEVMLRRVLNGRYTAAELQQDLDALYAQRAPHRRLERTPDRGPHVELWQRPEQLLENLAQRFPSEDRVTGWDWRGDVHLAFGPPAWIDRRSRSAIYTWGTPEVIQIGESMLGWAHSRQLQDTLTDFIETAEEEIQDRRRKGASATMTLANALRGSQSGGRGAEPSQELVLEQLHVLAPPPVFQIGIPEGGNQLPLTMDAVAFPAAEDSIEVQASFGIPTGAVQIQDVELGYTTDLRTSLVVMDHDFNIVYSSVRSMGYLIEGKPEIEDMLLLDTFRFKTVPGSYMAYLSAEDPRQETSGGALQNLDFNWRFSPGLQVSPIMLASEVEIDEGTGKFNRGGYRILPAPSRYLRYGYELYCYYEITNLKRSEFGDHAWQEAYYVIPDSPREGIVKVSLEQEYSRLVPQANRSMGIDLSSLESSYEGPIFLVVLITDKVSNEQAVGVTKFNLRRP